MTDFTNTTLSTHVNSKANMNNKSVTKQTIRNVDLITRVPYEILCNILDCLNTNTICTCIFVCHAWRNRIIQCHQPWQQLSLKLGREEGSSNNNIPLSSVSKYIHELTLSYPANHMTCATKLFQTLKLANLRSLKLLINDYGINGSLLDGPFYETLSLIGRNLKGLWIEWNGGLHGIKLNRILTTCRNLTSIHCITKDIIDWNVSHTTKLNLIHFEFSTRINPVDRLEILLQHSPDLRHIELRCNHTISILPTIHKYYSHPQLITLIANKAHFQRHFGPVRIPQPADRMQREGKLQCLVVSALGSTEAILPSILEYSRDTLQTLCLDIGVYHSSRSHRGVISSSTWEQSLLISPTPFPLLTYLHISDSSWKQRTKSFFRDHLSSMLHSCPALETLVLERFSETKEDYIIDDSICIVIRKLARLSCLRLINFYVNGPHFKQLLQHYAQMQTSTTISKKDSDYSLRQLAILNNDSVTPVTSNILWYIVRITTLEQLQLRCPHIEVTDADMADFTYFIRRLMIWLIHLELNNMPIHESAAENLAQCHSLWTLTIQGNNVQEMTYSDIQILEAHGKIVIQRTNSS